MHSTRRETGLLLAGDFVVLLLSLWLALVVRNFEIPPFSYFMGHVAAFLLIFAISILIFFIAGLYEKQTRMIKRVMGIRILGAQIANTIFAALLFFFLPLSIAPKTILVLDFALSVILISVWRFFIAPNFWVGERTKAVLIGSGEAANQAFQEVNRHRKYYVEFIAHIDTSVTHTPSLEEVLKEQVKKGAELIVLDTRDERVRQELPQLYDLMLSGISFSEFASFYESIFDRVPVEHIDHAWLLECLPKRHIAYDIGKAVIDRGGAVVGSIIALPFIGVAAILLLLAGGQPFIFHERIGRGEKPFKIIKLRTMLFNDHGDPELQRKNRVTLLGKILRKSRIDELPQIFNVLKGELSFIGPRPELPAIAATYEREIPYYEVRHLITPGLSGWAQIKDYDAPRGAADVERTRRKLSYDLYYLKHRSLGLDMLIALKTLRALLSFSGV